MQDQILALINISSATAIATAVGLALIGLGFLSFILRQGESAANGRIGTDDNDEREDD